MKKEIKIGGMHCSHCVRHVEEALEELGAKVVVSLDKENAVIEFDNTITDNAIINALDDFGYDVKEIIDI